MIAHVFQIDAAQFPGKLLNLNLLRGHTRHIGRTAAPWRALGTALGRATPGIPHPVTHPIRVWAEFRFPNDHRRDTANLYMTAKALVDGLVDAGVLLGDHDGIVEGPWLKRTYPNGPARLRLILVPITRAELGRELAIA